MREPIAVGAGLDDVVAEGEPSTIAARNWRSVKVFGQHGNDSFEAMATEFFFVGQNVEEQLGASLVESHVPQLVRAH